LAIDEGSVSEKLDLLDWKRQVLALYAEVRRAEPRAGWERWRTVRAALVRDHPQSPRPGFHALRCFDYDPAWRFLADVVPADPQRLFVAGSGPEPVPMTRLGRALFGGQALDLFWVEGYGGGLFLPFRDETSGGETYGGGRYLLDTVKGADLGVEGGRLVLDFNFAYSPSCAYDPGWACPLAPPGNVLDAAVRAGELTPGA